MSRAGSAEQGFTLLEILVVMAILGLLLAIAAPRFRSTGTPDLATRASLLASDLRAARLRAIGSGRPEQVALPQPAGAVAAARAAAALVFFPDGSSTGASIRLAEAERIAIVDVDLLTGAVRVRLP